MRIIPAIDLLNGKCVRLTKGNYSTQKIYNNNPIEVAKEFEANGIEYLHLVDLDGAKSNHIVNHKILNQISTQTKLKIDFGGGIKSMEDIEIAFSNGASQATVGSKAANDPDAFIEWLEKYGPEKIILGADCRNRKIATNGWQDTSNKEVIQFIEFFEQKKLKYVICTDISKDGMLKGTSEKLYIEILSKIKIQLIASGGVSNIEDLKKLKKIGCEGAIVGKAIYEGKISLKELKQLC